MQSHATETNQILRLYSFFRFSIVSPPTFHLAPRSLYVAANKNKINIRAFLRTHARKQVSDPRTKIICKQTLLITLFALYKLRNTFKLRLTGDQNTQYQTA